MVMQSMEVAREDKEFKKKSRESVCILACVPRVIFDDKYQEREFSLNCL